MTEPTLIIVHHYMWGWQTQLCTTRSHVHWIVLTAVQSITSTETVQISPGSIYQFVCLSPGLSPRKNPLNSDPGSNFCLCLRCFLDVFWSFQDRTGLWDLGGGIALLNAILPPIVFRVGSLSWQSTKKDHVHWLVFEALCMDPKGFGQWVCCLHLWPLLSAH